MVLGTAEMVARKSASTRTLGAPNTKRRSQSTGSLALTKTLSAPNQITSSMVVSPGYSFGPGLGKPRHQKGKIGIEVLDPRSAGYIPGITDPPPPGHYEFQPSIGRHDSVKEVHHAHQELCEKTGHPQFHRSPGYMFGGSTEPRDTSEKRHTALSHVRSSSFLDNPGPGAYMGLEEKDSVLTRGPSFSITSRPHARRRTSEPGPCEYDTRHKKDVVQVAKPSWTMSKASRDNIAIEESCGPGRMQHRYTMHMRTPDEIGPGSYAHSTSLVNNF